MHGRNRKSALFPLSLKRREIEANLQKIVATIHTYGSDIVTLQEIDQMSVLSGSFDHFEFLKTKLGYPYAYFHPSCSISLFDRDIFISGNAIFSHYPLECCEAYQFDVSFPTDRMGFVIANIKLPQEKILSVASVHLVWLDWLRRRVRVHQLALLRQVLAKRSPLALVAGDFNCDLVNAESSLRSFVEDAKLTTVSTNNVNFLTYPAWKPQKCIDYIFSSRNISAVSYQIIEKRLSDHLAVLARFLI